MEDDIKYNHYHSAMYFIRAKSSRNSCKKEPQRQRSKNEADMPSSAGGVITKWLKELRVSYNNSTTNVTESGLKSATVISRNNPYYHSEGKGFRKKKSKDSRRHSFNYRQITPPPSRRRTRTNGIEIITEPYFPAKNIFPSHTMMPARSTPNLQQSARDVKNSHGTPSIYTYLQSQSGLSFAPVSTSAISSRENGSSPPTPPVRDSSSLKSIKYGPGHEKFPSWPVPAAAEEPQGIRSPPSGGSHRSKSWTDHTNYPKEKVVTYTRPYMKRQYTSSTQQKLKTVMEKCEKIPPEMYESQYDKMNNSLYLPHVDHNGKSYGHKEYTVPSPPERDLGKIQLTQEDLEEYARSYQDPPAEKYNFNQETTSIPHLTKSGLQEFIEYSQNYEDSLYNHNMSKSEESILTHLHQKQLSSYAQSEGYHSYVSSADSISTPFLDRLRRDSEAITTRVHSSHTWDELSDKDNSIRHEGRDSVVTTSSGSVSSSETLKWHGSMSDVSVASSSCTHHANSSNSPRSRQLIAHSARVKTPQRHHSESVLYIGSDTHDTFKSKENRNDNNNKLKFFPVNTYTVQDSEQHHHSNHNNNQICNNNSNSTLNNNRLSSLSIQPSLSVADRVNELEKQQKFSYLDPDKKHKIPDPTLKAIQKKALLSFYERHHNNPNKNNSWHSEPQLAQAQLTLPAVPQPPPRLKVQLPSRRASSASDYNSNNGSKRCSLARNSKTTESLTKNNSKHQHSNSCGSLSADLLGPVIMGPSISLDDWIPEKPPERPPKNPHLRTAYPDLFRDQRIPSPDLPPPSPPTVLEDEVFNNDEPLPPPPSELETAAWSSESHSDKMKNKITSDKHLTPSRNCVTDSVSNRHNNGNMHSPRRISIDSSKQYTIPSQEKNHPPRMFTERLNANYSSVHKVGGPNGKVATSQKVSNGISNQYIAEPLKAQRLINKKENKSLELNIEGKCGQRTSVAEISSGRDIPPPLQPRQMRVNQSMRARIMGDSGRHGNKSSIFDKNMESRQQNQQMSHSKASYLTSRRECDRIIPESEMGSYKRTMSPNGSHINEVNNTPATIISRDTVWPLNRPSKENNSVLKNNNANLLRRASMSEKRTVKNDMLLVPEKLCSKDELKKGQLVLPDVLPDNARSRQHIKRPAQLSLIPVDEDISKKTVSVSPKSPAKSPSKSPCGENNFTLVHNNSPVQTHVSSTTSLSLPKEQNHTIPSPTIQQISNVLTTSTTTQVTFTEQTTTTSDTINTSPVNILSRLSPESTSTSSSSPLQTSPLTLLSVSPKEPSSPLISPPHSPLDKEECPNVIEGLQMIQRTEVVLRVNPCTTDASSQTEKEEVSTVIFPIRKKLQEEIDCDKLSQDFVSQLHPSDRLKGLLVPDPDHKKPTDYVSGLFNIEIRPRPANSPFRSRTNTPSCSPPPANNGSKISTSPLMSPVSTLGPTSPLSGTSIYFTTSEPKAKFLTRYCQDMHQYNIVKNTKDLTQKKEELVNRLGRKLEVLRSEQLALFEECKINNELGEQVEAHVNRVARSHEAAKYRLHVEEVGKITSLLLGLSGRLARAENALMGMPDDHVEKGILECKRDKLKDQLEEAKKLKESIDRRSTSVSNILCKYLNSDEYADYDHFINMKAKLIMDSKEIADKIKLGEEQLLALKETLIVTD